MDLQYSNSIGCASSYRLRNKTGYLGPSICFYALVIFSGVQIEPATSFCLTLIHRNYCMKTFPMYEYRAAWNKCDISFWAPSGCITISQVEYKRGNTLKKESSLTRKCVNELNASYGFLQCNYLMWKILAAEFVSRFLLVTTCGHNVTGVLNDAKHS